MREGGAPATERHHLLPRDTETPERNPRASTVGTVLGTATKGRRGAPDAQHDQGRHEDESASAVADAVPTSLDTLRSSRTTYQGLHVGGAWAAEFRKAVAEALGARWPVRARKMRGCGSDAVVLNCRGCGGGMLVPFRCGARTCPTCARIAAAKVVEKLEARILIHDEIVAHEPWDGPGRAQRRGWRMVTLTSPSAPDQAARFEPDALRHQVKRVRSAFEGFWRGTAWGRQVRDPVHKRKRARRDTSFVLALEVAPGGMVHVHALVFGEFLPQRVIAGAWSQALGTNARADVRLVKGHAGIASALREVLKYATKGEKGDRAQPARAAAVEYALRGVRRVEVGGSLRRIKIADAKLAVEVSAQELHEPVGLTCEGCGLVGKWRWGRVVPALAVQLNGGFGRYTLPDAFSSEPEPVGAE